MTAWFFGTFLMLIKNILDLNQLLASKQKQDPNNEDKSVDKKIFECFLGIIGKIGDLFPSGEGSGIAEMVLGKPFSEVTVGIGGFVAAIIAVRSAFP